MGRRDDNFIDDEQRDEAALLGALARFDEPATVAPPPDLVTRTARRLPQTPPATAVRLAARARAMRLGLLVAGLTVLVLMASLGVWSTLGGHAALPVLFGDGAGGLSRFLLTLQLLSKPLLRTIGSQGALGVSGLAALGGATVLWWWLLRRTPVQYVEQAP